MYESVSRITFDSGLNTTYVTNNVALEQKEVLTLVFYLRQALY